MDRLTFHDIEAIRAMGPMDSLPPDEAEADGLSDCADDTGHVDVVHVEASRLRALCDLAAMGLALSPPAPGDGDPFSAAHRRCLALLALAVPLPCELMRFAQLGLAAAAIHGGEPTTADLHAGDRLAGLQAAFVGLNAVILEARTAKILGDEPTPAEVAV